MEHITNVPSSHRTHGRLAAGLIGVSFYVLGGGLLLSHVSSAGVPSEVMAAPLPVDRVGAGFVPVSVSVIGGPTYVCILPRDWVSADAISVTADSLEALAPDLGGCS